MDSMRPLRVADFTGEVQREAVLPEINRRMDADPDDFIADDWIKGYLPNKYGSDLPI